MRVIVALLAPVRRLIPALGHVTEFAERAEVAEEGGGLVTILDLQDRVEELVQLLCLPLVRGHRPVLSPC
jgi:hypothetical protein